MCGKVDLHPRMCGNQSSVQFSSPAIQFFLRVVSAYEQQYVSTQEQCNFMASIMCTYKETQDGVQYGSVKAGISNCSMVCNFVVYILSVGCLADSDCQKRTSQPPICCSSYMSNCAWTDQNLAQAKASRASSGDPLCSDQNCITIASTWTSSSGARCLTPSALEVFGSAVWVVLTASLLLH